MRKFDKDSKIIKQLDSLEHTARLTKFCSMQKYTNAFKFAKLDIQIYIQKPKRNFNTKQDLMKNCI